MGLSAVDGVSCFVLLLLLMPPFPKFLDGAWGDSDRCQVARFRKDPLFAYPAPRTPRQHPRPLAGMSSFFTGEAEAAAAAARLSPTSMLADLKQQVLRDQVRMVAATW